MNPIRKLIALPCALWLGTACAQVEIGRAFLGSGQPGAMGFENASAVSNDVYHAPQYLPGLPTAATIYPRVMEVLCRASGAGLQCDGYNWLPSMGRAEYLFFTPVIAAAAPVAALAPELPAPVTAASPAAQSPELFPARSAAPAPSERPAKPKRPTLIKPDRQ
jgi:hypothetical protein